MLCVSQKNVMVAETQMFDGWLTFPAGTCLKQFFTPFKCVQLFSQCGSLQASTEDQICISAVCVFWCVCACWIYLQVEELQAVQLVEEVMGESSQLAAVHV